MSRILAAVLLISLSAEASDIKTRLQWLLEIPLLGLSTFEEPNPPTEATASLGRLLFYDKRLSKDGTISCSSCHEVAHSFANATAFSKGVGGALGNRKAMPILNRAFSALQFWDGRAATLEEQVLGPIENPLEMGNTLDNVVKTLSSIKGYAPLFEKAFGSSVVDIQKVAKAIADFERTLLSGNSKWDKWQNNPVAVVYSAEEERGFHLFSTRECFLCHRPPAFTDELFHNTGVAFKNEVFTDEGRFAFTKLSEDTGAFKTPTLRNVLSRAPYMHDGSLATLEAVIDFYNQGGNDNPHLSADIIPLGLKPADKAALLAFLATLQGEGFDDTPPLDSELPQ